MSRFTMKRGAMALAAITMIFVASSAVPANAAPVHSDVLVVELGPPYSITVTVPNVNHSKTPIQFYFYEDGQHEGVVEQHLDTVLTAFCAKFPQDCHIG